MATNLDRFSEAFVSLKKKDLIKKLNLLEIGSAYGAVFIKALENGAIFFANDIEPVHLEIIKNKINTNDTLFTLAAEFPYELDFENDFFDGILISHVLHFFTGIEIVNALRIIKNWLKTGGKTYIINETPYLSNWERFLPEYLERKSRNEEWPGEIENPGVYCNFRTTELPEFGHWLDHETLKNAELKSGFLECEIKDIAYINRAGQFPKDLLMEQEGKESVGCCLTKTIQGDVCDS
jgi:ubiquinone/menaquinone biosynthesis C-methylase UbiE